ncbi:MAG: phosphate acyltransferase [Verrucomicrobiota bacterium]|nr:phosphate acyltransferase [Verrucomicrobiota bacterium]
MKFIDTVFAKLRRQPKRIVFPEGTEPRVLHAVCHFAHARLGAPIVLGKRVAIEKVAASEKIDISKIGMIDPETSTDLDIFCERLDKLRHYRELGIRQSRDMMLNPNYFGAMMIQYGQADGLVGGASGYAGTLLRPLIQLIKPLPGVPSVSSCMAVELDQKTFGENGLMFFGDCAVIPEPDVDQLADIAVQTGKLCRQLTGIRPRIAMLSFSTKGSSKTSATQKVAAAAALAKKKAEAEQIDMDIDGELQVDTALLPDLAAQKAPSSSVAGHANVFIFPDLNSGNIAAKIVQHLAGAQIYGQILLGLSKPAADVSRGASVEDIVGVAAMIGLQAIEYRKLYPAEIDAG